MNSKMPTNSQLLTTKPKKKKKKTKQTTRTGTESQKRRSPFLPHGGLSVGKGRLGVGGKGTGNKKHIW